MKRSFLISILFILPLFPLQGKETKIAFFVCGDPQYLAEYSEAPQKLDPASEQANSRFIGLISKLPGTKLPKNMGGGRVSTDIKGLLITGDLIDSLDKRGGFYPAMQKFEWKRFLSDYGLNGKDGKIPYPVYEVHGNHDGPQSDTFIIDAIIERNKTRPGIVNVSKNGLHYSYDWGPIHLIHLGIFVGSGDKTKEGHHYAPRESLEFLKEDLKKHVGDSGRPVVVSHHLHLTISDYDWPLEDRAEYYRVLKQHNVIAIFNGHTHGSPPRNNRWDGKRLRPNIAGIDNFDPDDAGAAKMKNGKPVGLAHGMLYIEVIDRDGTDNDEMHVRSFTTRDNWQTSRWETSWIRKISVKNKPPTPKKNR